MIERFAKNYATKWDNIVNKQNPAQSPLYQAVGGSGKYKEVSEYVRNITELSRRQKQ